MFINKVAVTCNCMVLWCAYSHHSEVFGSVASWAFSRREYKILCQKHKATALLNVISNNHACSTQNKHYYMKTILAPNFRI